MAIKITEDYIRKVVEALGSVSGEIYSDSDMRETSNLINSMCEQLQMLCSDSNVDKECAFYSVLDYFQNRETYEFLEAHRSSRIYVSRLAKVIEERSLTTIPNFNDLSDLI
jgi:hypothetical protein